MFSTNINPVLSLVKDSAIIVANILPSDFGFGICADTGEGCFIPSKLIKSGSLEIGEQYVVRMTPNRADQREQTPWQVVSIGYHIPVAAMAPPTPTPTPTPIPTPTAPVQVKPQPEIDIPIMVRQTMLLGGIWDQGSMFDYLCPRASRNTEGTTSNSKEYNAVGHTLRAMFNNDDCAKYVFYRKGSQSRASKEFFLCYPNNVELVEYEDGDIGEDEA
jgi:hypothetical protein